jgi:hypothetical protein
METKDITPMQAAILAAVLETMAAQLTRLALELRSEATRYDGPGGGPLSRDHSIIEPDAR